MPAYYNEIDPFAAEWLRNLIAAKLIAPGEVDERSIVDVQPDDIKGFVQCHFFAGIAGWSLALRLAGWPDDRPVWTGSCPCQPLSEAGEGMGTRDDRHLWPIWFELIRERRPLAIFGEQVASGNGLAWLDIISADLATEGYSCGALDLCACGFGAPHIRQRLFFVSHSKGSEARPTKPENRVGKTVSRWQDDAPQAGRSIGLHGGSYWHPEPALCRVADGISTNVAAVSAYGNAIVPQVAAEFIGAVMELRP